MPVAEHLAGALHLKILAVGALGLVVVQAVGVFLPGVDGHVQSGWGRRYVGALERTFIRKRSLTIDFKYRPPTHNSFHPSLV